MRQVRALGVRESYALPLSEEFTFFPASACLRRVRRKGRGMGGRRAGTGRVCCRSVDLSIHPAGLATLPARLITDVSRRRGDTVTMNGRHIHT